MPEKSLSVALVSTYPPIHCGVGEYTRFLATAMSSVDPSTRIYVLAEEGVGRRFEDLEAGALVEPAFSRSSPAGLRGFLDPLSRIGPVDVLHVQHEYGIFPWGSTLLGALEEARRERLARRVVVTLHTVYRVPGGRGEIEFQRRLLDTVDAVIVHSPVQEYELHAQSGDYPGKLYRIPHGTMVNPYLGRSRRILAAALGIPLEELSGPIVSLPGFLRPDKGLDTLAEALRILRGKAPLLVVGGEPRGGALGLLEDVDRVHVIPKYLSAQEILMLSALSDALVLPYRDPPGKYAVSGVLHLSMGSLKPIIGSNVPRLYELYTLTPRLVFRSGDAEGLARRLRMVLDRSQYDIMVTYASPLYSYAVRTGWPRMAARHLSLYRRLLAGEEGEASASRSSA